MKGRIKRRLAQEQTPPVWAEAADDPICPLCERPIPAPQRDAHHLIPKSRGGTQTAWMHRICHRQIHALFDETELARRFHAVEALLAHPDVARFVAWVRHKPPEFYERTRKSAERRRRG